jgi:hypothetical protein
MFLETYAAQASVDVALDLTAADSAATAAQRLVVDKLCKRNPDPKSD